MRLAIMQPYFFPYIGYFQLIKTIDTFVVFDDVNFKKGGWINRNYVLLNGKNHLITLELNRASNFKLINQIKIGTNREQLVKTIFRLYTKAPFFTDFFPIVKESLLFEDNNLAKYVINSMKNISDYLNIKTEFVVSSEIENDKTLKGQDKILDICKIFKPDAYINAVGGQELYSKEIFKNNHVELFFVKTKEIAYKQFSKEFVPNLSIIDVLMFNSKDVVQQFLSEFELV